LKHGTISLKEAQELPPEIDFFGKKLKFNALNIFWEKMEI
jgi:hypothetical protein